MRLMLGQSVIYKPTNDEEQKLIYLGTDSKGEVFIDEDGEVISPVPLSKEIGLVREKDPDSPTGNRIYYGSLCKKMFGDFKIKVPEASLIKAEFEKLKSLS